LLGHSLSRVPGYDTRALIEAAESGKVDTLLCLGGNLWGANPASAQARPALGRIDTMLYPGTKSNQGHFHGPAAQETLVLPVFNRFETPHRTTTESGNSCVRLNEPGTTHLQQADLISEVGFLAELARRLMGTDPIDWGRLQDPVYVRELIGRTVPGYAPIAAIDESKREFTVEGRVFSEPTFATPSGRARMALTPLPELSLPGPDHFGGLAAGETGLVLALITARSYGQHNTVVYKPGDSYRGMPHRHTILMNRADLRRAGLVAHQLVDVHGEAGLLANIEVIPGEIREGAALMFYPEVNAIIRAPVDPRCGTPAYKRVPVLVRSPAARAGDRSR
jgi:anaerobic selenocysteine-containing dehydrogenase